MYAYQVLRSVKVSTTYISWLALHVVCKWKDRMGLRPSWEGYLRRNLTADITIERTLIDKTDMLDMRSHETWITSSYLSETSTVFRSIWTAVLRFHHLAVFVVEVPSAFECNIVREVLATAFVVPVRAQTSCRVSYSRCIVYT